jgi:predicted lipid carrier protein YhbT
VLLADAEMRSAPPGQLSASAVRDQQLFQLDWLISDVVAAVAVDVAAAAAVSVTAALFQLLLICAASRRTCIK